MTINAHFRGHALTSVSDHPIEPNLPAGVHILAVTNREGTLSYELLKLTGGSVGTGGGGVSGPRMALIDVKAGNEA